MYDYSRVGVCYKNHRRPNNILDTEKGLLEVNPDTIKCMGNSRLVDYLDLPRTHGSDPNGLSSQSHKRAVRPVFTYNGNCRECKALKMLPHKGSELLHNDRVLKSRFGDPPVYGLIRNQSQNRYLRSSRYPSALKARPFA